MECEQHAAAVSWQQSDFAVGYVAYFDNQRGHRVSCVGTNADIQCVVSGLMCGIVYSVWVKALGQQYNSSDSTVVTLTSGTLLDKPHIPHFVKGTNRYCRNMFNSWLTILIKITNFNIMVLEENLRSYLFIFEIKSTKQTL